MTIREVQFRALVPGTSGWAASDLDDPGISQQWEQGRYEILHGVLKTMPAADFDHGEVVIELLTNARDELRKAGTRARISTEVDLIVSDDDVLRVDGMLITPRELEAQRKVLVDLHRNHDRVGRIRVAPFLVIESVSFGHERHDLRTKRNIYAGFGIPNYWIVDSLRRTFECLILDGPDYRVDVSGRETDVVSPSCIAGLKIALKSLWELQD